MIANNKNRLLLAKYLLQSLEIIILNAYYPWTCKSIFAFHLVALLFFGENVK